jgi:hypothetical protein
MIMEDSKTPSCCSKFPWALQKVLLKIIDNLGTRSQKGNTTAVAL